MAARSTIDDFDVLESIGHGTYGVVFKVRRKQDGLLYAMKEVDLEGMSDKEQQQCIQETNILSSLNSPHIIKYYDSFLNDDKLCIVTEYASNGNLHDYIQTHKRKLPEELVWRLFIQILLGLNHMHDRKMLHRDIKTLNVFLDHRLNVKLGDMGVAKVLNSTASFARSLVGTPYYLSPELCEDRPYNYKSDVWAMGIVLYECCTQKHPFDADNQGALILKILRGKYPPVSGYSAELISIIQQCLKQNVHHRPSTSRLLQSPIVRQKASELGLPTTLKLAAASDTTAAAVQVQWTAADRQSTPKKPVAFPKPSAVSRTGAAPSQRVRNRTSAGQPARQLPTRLNTGAVQGVIRMIGHMDRPSTPPSGPLPDIAAGVTLEPIERLNTLHRLPAPSVSSAGIGNDLKTRQPSDQPPGTSDSGEGLSRGSLSTQQLDSSQQQAQPAPEYLPAEAAPSSLRNYKVVGPEKAFVFGSGSSSGSGHMHVSVVGTELTTGDPAPADHEEAHAVTQPTVAEWKVLGEAADGDGSSQGTGPSGWRTGDRSSSSDAEDHDEQEVADESQRQLHIRAALSAHKEACLELLGRDKFLHLYALLQSAQADGASMPAQHILKSTPTAMPMMCKLLYLEEQLEGTG